MSLHGIQYGGKDPAYQTKYSCIFIWVTVSVIEINLCASAVIIIFTANIIILCYFHLYCYNCCANATPLIFEVEFLLVMHS